jgi:hypothetical protein
MNTIKGTIDKSGYPIYNDFLNIQIDDKYLDEILEENYPGENYKGLIPALLTMELERESKIVWERIKPETGEKTLCPILMCPDDCDFSCTLIIAEIENKDDEIILWNKIGLDETESKETYNNPEKIGSKIKWLNKINPLTFKKNEYDNVIDKFKQYKEY